MTNQIGDRGKIRNTSQAASATNFEPEPRRLLRYQFDYLYSRAVALAGLGGVSLIAAPFLLMADDDSFGYVAILLAIIVFSMAAGNAQELRRFLPGTAFNFQNGLITAAVIDSVTPIRMTHIAVLSNQGDPENFVYGLLQAEYRIFPVQVKQGDRHACISVFFASDDVTATAWNVFVPTPAIFGTGDPDKLSACLSAAEKPPGAHGSYFDVLERFRAKNDVPPDCPRVYVCNGNGDLLEIRDLVPPGDLD